MSVKEFLVLFMICVIWGLHFIVMKVTVGETADPLFYAAVRMTIVMVLLSPRLRWHKGMMRGVIIAGLGYGALNYAFMFPAMGMTTASAAAVGIELYVPFSIILSAIFLGEKVGPRRIAGIGLAILGVTIIGVSRPSEAAGPLFLLGFFMIIGAAMSEAIGAIMVKKVTGVRPLDLLAWFSVVGTVVLWPLSLAFEDNQMQAFAPENRGAFIAALLYSAIGVSVIAHASYYWLLQRLPIYIVSTSGLMTTVIAIVASVLILKEPLTKPLLIGSFVTLIGISIILYSRKLHNIKTEPMPME
ncbi:MAG: DMT family transporter [Maricaulaceae bacterium]